MLSVSVSASAGWRSAFANSPSLAILIDPFSSEYAEWTWRWTNPALDMAAEGFAVMEWGNHWGLRGRQPAPQEPTRSSMVVPWARGVHVERATFPRRPAFPQGAASR